MVAERKLIGWLTLKAQSRQSTQYFPVNVEKYMYRGTNSVPIQNQFSKPWIFALKGEKGVLLLPAWLCIAGSEQTVAANTSLHTSDDTTAVDICGAGTSLPGLGLSPSACGTVSSCMGLVRIAGCASVLSVSTWRKK